MHSVDLTIVIPAYNEQDRLLPTLERVNAHFAGGRMKYEILVVDDGSRDRTYELARRFAEQHRTVRALRNLRNRGKGAAIRRGVAAARGGKILFTDADLSTPISEFEKLDAILTSGAGRDIVVGSRAVRGAHLSRHQPLYRELMGKTFNLLVRTIVFGGIKDTQCGFKLFRRQAARRVFSKMTIPGFGFDVEVLYLAQKMGMKISEVPVAWANALGSKVSPVRDAARMFVDLIRIKLRHG